MELDAEDRESFLSAISSDLASDDYWRSDAHAQWADFMVCVSDGVTTLNLYVIGERALHDLEHNVAWRGDRSAALIRKYRDRHRNASLRKMGYVID